MLNRIIRLQAVLEIVSNKTALALDHISDQLTQTRSVIYQIRLAVDYLLADEGGICGKFNNSECCPEINDKNEVIKNISQGIRKIAYVGTQHQKGTLGLPVRTEIPALPTLHPVGRTAFVLLRVAPGKQQWCARDLLGPHPKLILIKALKQEKKVS
uniref:ENR1 protein n=1 Tax=Cyanistes caeruleus TaxID=156563 RepID=A0A8C0U6U8_CYACU